MITTKTTGPAKAKPAPKDAIALLKADHAAVSQMFADYEKTRSIANKKALVAKICTALTVHAPIEEEIFYPAVKAALKDKLLVPEATVEHASVKDLIGQLEGVQPDGEMYDAKAKASSADMVDLGARMAARKDELLAQVA
jgi:hemerythrin superfamily protein